ncbi:MAG: rod shape-determining protein [Thermodesulfobacteria bacterium]|nr:rod shape-determining protein [Thermodesulfobacteriota bacterium]
MALNVIRHLLKQDVAIDLGTANSLIYLQGEGVVLNEPTVIAGNSMGEPVAVGRKAKAYLGKTPPGMVVKRPMKAGAVEDVDAVSLFLKEIVAMARDRRPVLSSKVIICIPSRLTHVEKRAVLDAARDADFKKVYLLEEAMAAAIGAGLDVASRKPSMVVDIGGGTTEVAVISQMAYVVSDSRRIGGDDLDEALRYFMLRKYGLRIGPNTAERLKWDLGSATLEEAEKLEPCRVGGQDVTRQIPAVVDVTPQEVQDCLSGLVDEIAFIISEVFTNLDSSVKEEIAQDGIHLTGGVSLLRGLDKFLEDVIGVPVKRVKSPLETVVFGAGQVLSSFKTYKSIFSN